ncbi:hypothetical protein V8F06_008345 [Rhypophila decipiens]
MTQSAGIGSRGRILIREVGNHTVRPCLQFPSSFLFLLFHLEGTQSTHGGAASGSQVHRPPTSLIRSDASSLCALPCAQRGKLPWLELKLPPPPCCLSVVRLPPFRIDVAPQTATKLFSAPSHPAFFSPFFQEFASRYVDDEDDEEEVDDESDEDFNEEGAGGEEGEEEEQNGVADKAPPKKKLKRAAAGGDADVEALNGNGTHEDNSEEEEEEEFDDEGDDDEGDEEDGEEEDAEDEVPLKGVKVSAPAKTEEAGAKEAAAAGGDEED